MATLKPSQRAAIEEDLIAKEDQLTNPNIAPYIQNKSALHKEIKQMKKVLDEQAPHPYETGAEKDAAAKRAHEILEEMKIGMPSKQEMRRNRDGSVHKHMKWEKANKAKILERREIIKRLNWDSDDPDLTNYEKYRPDQPFGYDVTAQIPGHHAMSPEAKKNWPETMAEPKAKTAVSHLKKEKGKSFTRK
jgi:hypothetical protein